MRVKALRGVCIGPGQHLAAGQAADLEPALVTFLAGIGAVKRVEEPTPAPQEKAKDEPKAPLSDESTDQKPDKKSSGKPKEK